MKQSIYFRVPSDIADLIGIDPDAGVTLNLEEQDDRFLLIYSVQKGPAYTSSLSHLRNSRNSGEENPLPVPRLRAAER